MSSQQETSMNTLRPYFWIRRNDDTFVPLIPLDELPEYIHLNGVSVTKDWDEVRQGEWRLLGDRFNHSGKHYTADVFNQPLKTSTSDTPSTVDGDGKSQSLDAAESASQTSRSNGTPSEEVSLIECSPHHIRLTHTM